MEKILKKKTVYQGRVVAIEEVDIDFDNGKTATFELINFNVVTGITILPIDDQDFCYFVKQFKLGAKDRIINLPSGGLEVGEDPLEAANKELQEEIGFKSNNISLMFRSHSSPGYVGSEAAYYYLAKDLIPSKLPGDEIESIQIIKLPFEKALKMVRSGEIKDTGTITAILYYQQFY
jgi:8-oxo-dGTP pyrophosphatase MutT (NUDIX family)